MSNGGRRKRASYDIHEKLGHGSYGIVYKGLDRATNRPVALKEFKVQDETEDESSEYEDISESDRDNTPSYGTHDATKRGTSSNATESVSLNVHKKDTKWRANRMVAKCGRHPNIIDFLGDYIDPKTSRVYYVFEYAEGGNLFHRLARLKKFSEADARDILKGMLKGLKHLHDNNIIHRDVKPGNTLLLTKKPPFEVALADFDMSARIASEKGTCIARKVYRKDRVRTRFEINGTKEYCAPEVFSKSRRIGPKADIWSVGVILHMMLLRQHPFIDLFAVPLPPFLETRERIKKKDLDFNRKEYSNISPDGRDLLSKLLKKSSALRFSASEALAHPWFKTTQDDKIFSSSELNKQLDRIRDDLAVFMFPEIETEKTAIKQQR